MNKNYEFYKNDKVDYIILFNLFLIFMIFFGYSAYLIYIIFFSEKCLYIFDYFYNSMRNFNILFLFEIRLFLNNKDAYKPFYTFFIFFIFFDLYTLF